MIQPSSFGAHTVRPTTLVVPAISELVANTGQWDVVLKIFDANNLSIVHDVIMEKHARLIWIRHAGALSDIEFNDYWRNTPIALYVERMGSYTKIRKSIEFLKELNIRVFFPATSQENVNAIRMLSSLKINTGVTFPSKDIDYESVNELMQYAVYSRAVHAPIEPFYSVTSRYKKNHISYIMDVSFDNPREFLHIDDEINIAVSDGELHRKSIIGCGWNDINSIETNERYISAISQRREFFMKFGGCSVCEAWRVCGGGLLPFGDCFDSTDSSKCRSFAMDLLDAAEYVSRSEKAVRETKWQF